MTSRLASLLVQDGLVSAKKMAEAFQRQVIYGGTLDTILLEMDVVDEGTLLDALGRSSALPIAGDLPSLEQLAAADVQKWMPPAMSERFRAVPVALDGNTLRVLVIDPPDRKQLDELGYTLSLTIEPIIVPEHRFVQAAELVYGVPVPARFASLAAKLRQRATDPGRARLTPSQPSLPMQPAREVWHAEPNAPVPVGDRIKDGTPTEPQRVGPVMQAQHAPPVVETARKVVTDVPMPGAKPETAPASQLAGAAHAAHDVAAGFGTLGAAFARAGGAHGDGGRAGAGHVHGGDAAARRRGLPRHRRRRRSRRHLRVAVPRHAGAAAVRRGPSGARRRGCRQAGARRHLARPAGPGRRRGGARSAVTVPGRRGGTGALSRAYRR